MADEKLEGDASRTGYGYDPIGLEVEDIEDAFTDLSAKGYSLEDLVTAIASANRYSRSRSIEKARETQMLEHGETGSRSA